ncbi:MAG: haloacid dehalogenase [Bdellovibrionales bacterium CG10_big_fil_rev_8_21_14_0_10_45_34]|nr:MAG: haloacid dehalogenase [Bdellovibrionales bacterium CG10_big_fil_rev_8_21_14_0_10_45_34]
MNAFSSDLWTQLKRSICAVDLPEVKRVAAFDADGTLWNADVGEHFFNFEIAESKKKPEARQNSLSSGSLMPLFDSLNEFENPFDHYLKLKEKHPPTAYLWLAQIHAGMPIEDVRTLAAESCATANPWPYFNDQRMLVSFLQENDFQVFIITASVKWSVEPFAKALGIDFDHVLGVSTLIDGGYVTEIQDGPVTWRKGKLEALLRATNGVAPVFCSGNTSGDLELLEASTIKPLAVRSRSNTGSLLKSELELYEVAKKKGWLTHEF